MCGEQAAAPQAAFPPSSGQEKKRALKLPVYPLLDAVLKRHSAYSLTLPSKTSTWPPSSKASVCEHTRSRKKRSWLTTTTQPANSSSA